MGIKSIVIEIGGKELSLSLEEARKLYKDLGGVFAEPCKLEKIQESVYPGPYIPGPIWQIPPYPWDFYKTTCGGGHITTTTTDGTQINNAQ